MAATVITLLTDFGLQDGYVAAMKGVMLGIAPGAKLVDVSHLTPPQDVRSAAFVLFTCYEYFPKGTVHLAVVDPEVGTGRKPIAVRCRSCFLVGPDNGIFSLVLKNETGWQARSIENPDFRLKSLSATFHGRDLFAPAAARIAAGRPFDLVGPECDPVVSQWGSPVHKDGRIEAEVIHVDRFGNSVTNVTLAELEKFAPARKWAVRAPGVVVPSIVETYGQTPPGSVLALVGSSGFVELAVNRGDAASQFGLRPGMKVSFTLERT